MSIYTIFAEGPGKEFIVQAVSEREAYRKVFRSMMTDDERNATACLDCIDIQSEVAA